MKELHFWFLENVVYTTPYMIFIAVLAAAAIYLGWRKR